MGVLYASSATERGIRERRQRAPACLPAPEPASEPVPAPEPAAPANVVRLVIPRTEMQELIAAIAHKHGVTVADIIGPRRFRKVVVARTEAIRAVKEARPCLSLNQLGRMFHRNHEVIHYFLHKAES